MYMQAHRNVMEIQRIEKDIKNGGESLMNENNGNLNSFNSILNKIINIGLFSNLSQM